MVGAERLARSRLPDSKSGGSAIPREPRAESWHSWRDSHPLVIRLERATARRLCAQEQLTLGRDGRSRAGNLLDVTEPLC